MRWRADAYDTVYVQPRPTDHDALQQAWSSSVVASAVAAKTLEAATSDPQLAASMRAGTAGRPTVDLSVLQPVATRELDALLQGGGLEYLDAAQVKA